MLRSSASVNFDLPRDNRLGQQIAYKTSETLRFWGFSLPVNLCEMTKNVVEIGGYVCVCSKNHSNYVIRFKRKKVGTRKADTGNRFVLSLSEGEQRKGQGWNRCQHHYAGYDVHYPGRSSGSGNR